MSFLVSKPLKPQIKPLNPCFASGPTAKHKGWDIAKINFETIGRSHRSDIGKTKLKQLIEKISLCLNVPEDFYVGILTGSATSAVECAMWSLLGPLGVDVMSADVFGHLWAVDALEQLNLRDLNVYHYTPGQPIDLSKYNPKRDLVFTWNGSTSGTCVPNGDWIVKDRLDDGFGPLAKPAYNEEMQGAYVAQNRSVHKVHEDSSNGGTKQLPLEVGLCKRSFGENVESRDINKMGLTICDATSAAFCFDLPWDKMDATCFSLQKGLGGVGAHGVIVLSPKAISRLQNNTPSWPIPRLFKLANNGDVNLAIFHGLTINTPSMMCVEEAIYCLDWALQQGGIKGLVKKCQDNFGVIKDWVVSTDWVEFLAQDPSCASPTTVVLKILPWQDFAKEKQWELIRGVAKILAEEGAAFDIVNHIKSLPSFRIWCGPTVEAEDIKILLSWLEWGVAEIHNDIVVTIP